MVIPLNRVYCKHPIYHKTSYNKSGGVKASSRKRMKKSCLLPNCLPTISRSARLLIMKFHFCNLNLGAKVQL